MVVIACPHRWGYWNCNLGGPKITTLNVSVHAFAYSPLLLGLLFLAAWSALLLAVPSFQRFSLTSLRCAALPAALQIVAILHPKKAGTCGTVSFDDSHVVPGTKIAWGCVLSAAYLPACVAARCRAVACAVLLRCANESPETLLLCCVLSAASPRTMTNSPRRAIRTASSTRRTTSAAASLWCANTHAVWLPNGIYTVSLWGVCTPFVHPAFSGFGYGQVAFAHAAALSRWPMGHLPQQVRKSISARCSPSCALLMELPCYAIFAATCLTTRISGSVGSSASKSILPVSPVVRCLQIFLSPLAECRRSKRAGPQRRTGPALGLSASVRVCFRSLLLP